MKIIYTIIFISLFYGCKSKLKPRELGAYQYNTSCVSNINGELIVSAFGSGSTKEICETQAIKKAINDVIFKGINNGNINCYQPPILSNVNAEKEYQNYFDNFFSENGQYLTFAKIYDEARSQSRSKKIRKLDKILNQAIEFQISVDRKGLVKLLNQDLLKNSTK